MQFLTSLLQPIVQGFSNWGSQSGTGWSHKVTSLQLICVSMTHTHTHTHTVQSGATGYTNINYELRYCLVQFSNCKGCDLKHALRVLKSGCAQVVITVRVSVMEPTRCGMTLEDQLWRDETLDVTLDDQLRRDVRRADPFAKRYY